MLNFEKHKMHYTYQGDKKFLWQQNFRINFENTSLYGNVCALLIMSGIDFYVN